MKYIDHIVIFLVKFTINITLKPILLLMSLIVISTNNANAEPIFPVFSDYCYYYLKKATNHIGCFFDNGKSCYYLANQYNGDIDNIDDTLYYFGRACDLAVGEGCHELADIYYSGDGSVVKNLNKASDLYKKACELDIGISCGILGEIYKNSDNIQLAIKFHEKACDLNVGSSCRNLAVMNENGSHITKDIYQAIDFYKKGCELNNSLSCLLLANIYSQGIVIDKDLGLAFNLLEASHEEKYRNSRYLNKIGCSNLKSIHHNTNVYDTDRDINRVIEARYTTCSFGDPYNCLGLDILYYKGIGVNKDIQKTIQIRKKLCDINYASACTGLATIYLDKSSKDTYNLKEGLHFGAKACDLNDSYGCYILARQFEFNIFELMDQFNINLDKLKQISKSLDAKACSIDGTACDRLSYDDFNNEIQLSQAACDLGQVNGCLSLAGILEDHDLERAISSYQKACDLGSSRGCASLAGIYKGIFFHDSKESYIDLNKAVQFYQRACNLGDNTSCFSLSVLYEYNDDIGIDLSASFYYLQKSCELDNK